VLYIKVCIASSRKFAVFDAQLPEQARRESSVVVVPAVEQGKELANAANTPLVESIVTVAVVEEGIEPTTR
jgi:hypothetical protein